MQVGKECTSTHFFVLWSPMVITGVLMSKSSSFHVMHRNISLVMAFSSGEKTVMVVFVINDKLADLDEASQVFCGEMLERVSFGSYMIHKLEQQVSFFM